MYINAALRQTASFAFLEAQTTTVLALRVFLLCALSCYVLFSSVLSKQWLRDITEAE